MELESAEQLGQQGRLVGGLIAEEQRLREGVES